MARNSDDHVSEPLARGASIGRYVVLGLLGRGGMGEVYAAFDPELDRKVAVKLLRARTENGVSITEGRQRTLREAQAIARLSHPNVVTVFDVGTFGDQVFIAMEFVDGHTASYWVQAQPRTWQETRDVYLAAGRGLQAAHEKGLVHRDFKPENVMVGRDGEVRVMDFGLAREIDARATRNGPVTTITTKFGDVRTDGGTIVLHQAAKPESPPVSLANDDGVVREMQDTQPSPGSDAFVGRLTRTGAIMGTPAYMAPEQFFKAATDARSDQFSFCVTLYEALYGERPYPGNNIQTLVGNIVQGNIREPPAGTKVPFWLRKVLLRGLRPTAAERYPSMEELLDALKTDPRAKYRRFAAGLTLGLLPLTLGFGVRAILADKPPACIGTARLAGTWELHSADQPDSSRQAQIRAAFLRTGKTYAVDVFDTVSRALTSYAQSWADMYKETCEATQVRHDQSGEILDLRMSCLNDRLNGLHALTDVFSDANGEVVENAVAATNALATLDRCADVPTLRAVIKPPEDSTTAAKVAELRTRLAEVKARFDAGNWKEALKAAPSLVNSTRALDYKPLLAEALALHGNVLLRANQARQAENVLIEAFWTADSGRHDEVRAEVAAALVYVVGAQELRFDESHRWGNIAESILARLGGHDLLRAWLLNDIGCVLELQGDQRGAVQVDERAIALKEKVLGQDHPDVGISEVNLAVALHEEGRDEDALRHNDRAIRVISKGLGPDHPDLAMPFNDGGEIMNALGRHDEARTLFEKARMIWERELGSESVFLGYALTGIGVSNLQEGKPAEAIAPLEHAYAIRRAREPDLSKQAETSFALARAYWESNRSRARARQLAQEAMEQYAKSHMPAKVNEIDGWVRVHASS